MADALKFAVSNLRVVEQVKKFVEDAEASMESSDPGRAYERIVKWKNERAYLTPGGAFKAERVQGKLPLPCESPAVQAFRRLYAESVEPGVVHVVFDAPGTGKSMGGVALLEDYHVLANHKNLKGIMISTGDEEGSYVELVRDILQTATVEGWLHLLLWSLSEPKGSAPALLVLDDFDLGPHGEMQSLFRICTNA